MNFNLQVDSYYYKNNINKIKYFFSTYKWQNSLLCTVLVENSEVFKVVFSNKNSVLMDPCNWYFLAS